MSMAAPGPGGKMGSLTIYFSSKISPSRLSSGASIEGAEEMIVIAVFLAVIGIAGGLAVWNESRSPWCVAGSERREPRFPLGSI